MTGKVLTYASNQGGILWGQSHTFYSKGNSLGIYTKYSDLVGLKLKLIKSLCTVKINEKC